MKSYIKYIAAIDKNNKHHYVEFREGLNIITGKSSTGKSAIIEIFDYCFGSTENTVPEGIITNTSQLYFVVMKVMDRYLVLGRKPNDPKAFLKEETEDAFVNNINNFTPNYFGDFMPLGDFRSELSKSFGIEINDTDTDLEEKASRHNSRKKEKPSARHFTSFMLQHQNLVANKHSLFYRFDEKEKRDQTIDQFKIFAGFFDQDYFIKKQSLNEYLTRLKQLQSLKEKDTNYKKSIAEKLAIFLNEYLVIAGKPLIIGNAETILLRPFESLNKIHELSIQIDDLSNEDEKIRTALIANRNKLIAQKRRQQIILNNITDSVNAVTQYQRQSKEIEIIEEVKLRVSDCPFCTTPHEQLIKEANDLTEAIDWLNSELTKSSYVIESFKSDEKKAKLAIQVLSDQIRKVNKEIKSVDDVIGKLDKNQSLDEQALKVKFRIESFLEEMVELGNSLIDQDIEEVQGKIDIINEDILKNYNSQLKITQAESIINWRMKTIGANLDFENFYKPINLKFSLETFDLYHQDKNGKRIYLRSMGSGANWLYSHLALFTSLQYYFCTLGDKCLIPPILFIDQPSQVYFPSSIDNKTEFNASELKKQMMDEGKDDEEIKEKTDEDVISVTNMYEQLLEHCETTKENTGIMPQIIVTDHADKLVLDGPVSFEELVAGRRWRTRGFIEI